MARLAATDCQFSFTDDATSKPTTTEIGTLITDLYEQAYNYIYDHDDYSADETTDINGLIDSSGFRAVLQICVQNLVEDWHIAGTFSDGNIIKMPPLQLDKDCLKKLDRMIAKNTDKTGIDNIRFGGSDYTDWEYSS